MQPVVFQKERQDKRQNKSALRMQRAF